MNITFFDEAKNKGNIKNYLYNGHGDVTALVDESGAVVASYDYDSFGNVTEESGDADNPYRYAGYTYDGDSKLYYLDSRFYDAKIARFLQEDTYRGDRSDPLSLNLYAYCRNNPLMYTDRSGHAAEVVKQEIFDGPYGAVIYTERSDGSWSQDPYSGNAASGSSINNPAVYYPSESSSTDYNSNNSFSNKNKPTDAQYREIAQDLGLATVNSPYKDVIDTMLGIGGFDSFTNVTVANGVALLNYNQRTNENKITINYEALIGYGASLPGSSNQQIVGPQSSIQSILPGILDTGYGYGGIYDANAYMNYTYGNNWYLSNTPKELTGIANFVMNDFRLLDNDQNNCVPTAITRVITYILNKQNSLSPGTSSTIYSDVMTIAQQYSNAGNGNTDYMKMSLFSIDDILSDSMQKYNLNGEGKSKYFYTDNTIKAELDADRPLLLNLAFGYYSNHTVTVIGYSEFSNDISYDTRTILHVYDGWDDYVKYIDYSLMRKPFTSSITIMDIR